MPRIYFKTHVAAPVNKVAAGFNHTLFLRLAPPFPKVDVTRFDGCLKGDEVHLVLNFLLFKQHWHSTIVQHVHKHDHFEFVDQGTTLPWPLTFWHHQHIVMAAPRGSYIIDQIYYRAVNRLLGALSYPFLWLLFAYRKPIYRRIFGTSSR